VGWVLVAIIESSGATSLQLDASNHYILTGSSTATLRFGGGPVTMGQFGAWTPIAAEQTPTGFEIVWKNGTFGEYIVWNTDLNGNFLSQGAVLSASSAELQSLEPGFSQDLNGSGGITPSTPIDSVGSTALAQVGSAFVLSPAGSALGPQLRMSGALVAAGQFGAWTPTGAEQSGLGYLVVWKNTALNQYVTWSVDGGGNFLSQSAALSPTSFALESLEVPFGQNLNGDGTTGVTTAPIESAGSTTLPQVADSYFVNYGSLPVQLRYGGMYVAVSEFGAWVPIAAEQAGGVYQIAWRNGAADEYLAWNIDSTGNFLSQGGVVSGASWYVQSFETAMHQNLNGDSTTGPVTAPIEAIGSTTLTQVADSYFVNYGGSSAVQLFYGNAYAAANQFGAWKPVAAEQVGGTYQVAWQNGTANQFLAWTVGGAGNFVTQTAVVAGTTWYLQSYENTVHQDLNGDGTTGAVTSVVELSGATVLTKAADSYFVNYGTPSAVQVNYGGAYAGANQFSGWSAIGAEQIMGGYEVVWQNGSNYTVWNTDGAGNFRSQSAVIAQTSAAFAALEASFRQDMNGDHSTASPTAVESAGSTVLEKVGNAYYLAAGGLSGPLLTYNGVPVTAGQFGAWTPLGAEWTGNGYAVAWKMGSVDQYTVWNTDSGGNYVSQTAQMFGSSAGLEVYEPTLHQDINGDGLIGLPTPAFNIDVAYSGDQTYRSFFTQAAQRWQQVITGDLPGFNVPGYGFVDDLHITASVGSIDGRGGILGQTRVEYYRTAGGQPISAFMTFDSADLATMAANGTLSYVILHEMGHTLGLGQGIWSYDGLTTGTTFTGAHASLAYQLLGGSGNVPLETGGGSGTAGSHWSEAVFGNELMTGFISGVPDPLSTVTVGALQDMGYTVNYSAADAYTLGQRLVDGGASVSTGTGTGTAALVAGGDGLAKFDSADASVLMTNYDATTVSEIDGFGNLGTGNAPAVLVSDASGNGGASAGGLQLFTNYLASTLIAPPGAGTGGIQAAAPSYDTLLAHPTA
jgi:Tryptophan-rich Synechocystis species C-terminal domain/Leishmanolysin